MTVPLTTYGLLKKKYLKTNSVRVETFSLNNVQLRKSMQPSPINHVSINIIRYTSHLKFILFNLPQHTLRAASISTTNMWKKDSLHIAVVCALCLTLTERNHTCNILKNRPPTSVRQTLPLPYQL